MSTNLNRTFKNHKTVIIPKNNLEKDKPKLMFAGKTASLITSLRNETDKGDLATSEGVVAFADEDSSARYVRLQSKGINILRSEIISISEFIPIVDSGNENFTLNKGSYVDSSNTTVNLNNVFRLIELHRQIRDYILNAADKVLIDTYPDLYNADFVDEIEKSISKNFERNIKENLEKTLEQVLNSLLEETFNNKNISSQKIIKTINENKNNPVLKGMIEYFVYSNVVEEIIKYLGVVAQLDEDLKKHWSIEKFNSLMAFSPENTFTNSKITNALAASNINTSDMRSSETILNNILCLERSSNNSDTDILINSFSHLASILSFKDSVKALKSIPYAGSSYKKISPGEVRVGIINDLYDAAIKIKNINLAGFISSLGPGTDIEREGAGSYYDNSRKLTNDNYFSNFWGIKQFNDLGKKSKSIEGSAELLALAVQDLMVRKVSLRGSNTNQDKIILNLFNESKDITGLDMTNAINQSSDMSYLSYLSILSGIPVDYFKFDPTTNLSSKINRSAIPASNDNSNLSCYSGFIKKMAGYRLDSNESGVRYLPLESSSKETLLDGNEKNYETSTTYFIERAIEKSGNVESLNATPEIKFDDLDKFSEDYLAGTNKIVEQVLTYTPNSKIIKNTADASLKTDQLIFPMGVESSVNMMTDLLKDLVSDLEKWIELEGDDDKHNSVIPLLACILKDQNVLRKKKDFLATFWATILFGKENAYIENAIGFDGKYRKKVLGRFFDFYHNSSAYRFFKDTCGYTFDENDGKYFEFKGGSGVKYRAIIRDGSENIINKSSFNDKKFSSKSINRECDSPWSSGSSVKSLVMNRNQVHHRFASSFGDGKKDLHHFRDGREGKNESGVGFARLFNTSMNSIIRGKIGDYSIENFTFDDDGIDRSFSLKNLIYTGENGDALDGKSYQMKDEFANFGGIVNFSGHHRAYIWYIWVWSLIRRTVDVRIAAYDKKLEIKINTDQINGVIDGIKDAISEISGKGKTSQRFATKSYKESKSIAKSKSSELLSKLTDREDLVLQTASLFSSHAASLRYAKDKVVTTLQGSVSSQNGGEDSIMSNKRKLAINTLKETGVYSDAIVLNNDITPTLIAKSYERFLKRKDNSLFAKDLFYTQRKTRFMYNVLSQKGFGLTKEEKRGNKTILNVGIPNSMISYMRKEAFEETKDASFSSSPYVCISVYKKSHLHPDLTFLPKNFIFDTSANIFDTNVTSGNLSKHLREVKNNITFDNLLKSVEITRLSLDKNGKIIKKSNSGYSKGVFNKEVLINHVFDYALKEYQRMTTGLDLNESTFLLKNEPIKFDNIEYTSYTTQDLQEEYRKILGKISLMYPEINIDSQLKSEVYRLVQIIKQSYPFSHVNMFKKVVTPKTFDNVYSILINEKDFILDTQKEIFNETIVHSVNSRISRPKTVSTAFENVRSSNINSANNILNNTNQVRNIKNYIKTIGENYPDVYNYTVSVSLLPIDFMEGSEKPFEKSSIIINNRSSNVSKSNIDSSKFFKK